VVYNSAMETLEKRTTLRLSTELFRSIQAQARAEKRSLNAQMLYLLEQSLRPREQQERPRSA
jgi:hypothetical protein